MKSEKLLMNIAVNKAKTKLKKILQQIAANTKTKILQHSYKYKLKYCSK